MSQICFRGKKNLAGLPDSRQTGGDDIIVKSRFSSIALKNNQAMLMHRLAQARLPRLELGLPPPEGDVMSTSLQAH